MFDCITIVPVPPGPRLRQLNYSAGEPGLCYTVGEHFCPLLHFMGAFLAFFILYGSTSGLCYTAGEHFWPLLNFRGELLNSVTLYGSTSGLCYIVWEHFWILYTVGEHFGPLLHCMGALLVSVTYNRLFFYFFYLGHFYTFRYIFLFLAICAHQEEHPLLVTFPRQLLQAALPHKLPARL